MKKDPFVEYLKEKDPSTKQKKYSWYTAIGLQKVDGLKTSDYLKEVAKRNIEGEITLDDSKRLIDSYYKEAPDIKKDTEEADKVSVKIAKILSKKAFTFSVVEYVNIHKFLFEDVCSHAGKFREHNITKKEWILDADTVVYGNATTLKETLEYDINQEKKVSYARLTKEQIIKHISTFVANLWQIHPFSEGNTRTTAVFLIKYLRLLGFNVTNDLFAENAWYFRNALVRANYNNASKQVFQTTEYLELFLKNLLYNENNVLSNRYLHVNYKEKPDIGAEKPDIGAKKPDIGLEKMPLTTKTKENIIRLFNSVKTQKFGRKEVIKILGLSPSRSSELLKQLLDFNIIVPIQGYGKGKYVFNI
ncbi:MAG: Fic family protein [Bacilli bacterium]|jgi:fido (protein-threonine AMPylation protein)